MLTVSIKCKNSTQAAEMAFRMRNYLYGSFKDGSKAVRTKNASATVTLPDSDGNTVILTIGNDPDNMSLFVNRVGEAVNNG